MAQPLSHRIAHRTHESRLRCHTGTIITLRDDIQAALNDGWSRRAIWETLYAEKRVTVKYHAFLRYLRRARILGAQPAEEASGRPASPPALPPRAAADGFRFNARPNEKDLT